MRIYLERTAAQINIAQVDANHHQSMQYEASNFVFVFYLLDLACQTIAEETVLLREQLVQEQAIRRRREEYNQLAKQVMELPSDLLMQIEQVKGETENIRQRQRDLDTQVAEYRVKVGRILQQLECLRDEMKE